MKFGVGIDYSLKALLMLAERYPTVQPLRVEEIASREGIPENYLRRLLIDLKRARAGRQPERARAADTCWRAVPAKITMDDVVQIIEGDYTPVECFEDGANSPAGATRIARCARYGAKFTTRSARSCAAQRSNRSPSGARPPCISRFDYTRPAGAYLPRPLTATLTAGWAGSSLVIASVPAARCVEFGANWTVTASEWP